MVFYVGAILAGALLIEPTSAAAQLNQGERLWFHCRACHTLHHGEPHKLGPNLYGIINAPAATRNGYRYSEALASSGIIWDDATLDRWIKRPDDVLVGHRMIYRGMRDPQRRADLIDFMKVQTGVNN